MKSIINLKQNEEGIIEKIERVDLACVQRLMTLGLVEGSTIKYLDAAIGGDPITINMYGATLSFRKDCASHFFVK